MADNHFDPPLGAGNPNKKAGLTKPERTSPKRSLPPPPPSAVKAATQKSLPPPPAIDVDIDDGEEHTVVQARETFDGFFDAPESEGGNPKPAAASPWALPPVVVAEQSSPFAPLPVDSEDTPPATVETPSEVAETRDLARERAAFAAEPDPTMDVPDAEIVTSAVNEKPELAGGGSLTSGAAAALNAPAGADGAASDDLDSLLARKSENDLSLPARSSGLAGKPPPPPPSLKPPPPFGSKLSPPPTALKSSAPPPPPSGMRLPVPPVALGDIPLPAPAPLAVLPEPESASMAAPLHGNSALPPASLPPAMGAPGMGAGALPPLPAPPLPSAPPPPPGGLSFHDDDVTTIFDRGNSVDSIPPPALPSLSSRPLPSFAPQAGLPQPGSLLTFSDPPPSEKKPYQRPAVLGAIGAALLAVLLTVGFWPSAGRLVVAVAGPNGTIVDGIQVTVDDKVVCTTSPCQVEDLEAKSYLVSVTAEGFEKTAPQAVIVKSGEDAVHNVTLQAPVVVAPTGLDVLGSTDFTLTLDGKEIGALPQKVLDLTPGEHVLRVSGGDRYEDEEKLVTVVEGQVIPLQPFALKVKRGRAIIEAGNNAEEATIRLDGKTITLPHKVDLDTSKKHTLIASRDGFLDFVEEIEFPNGKAERTFTVTLESNGEPTEATEEAAPQEPVARSSAGRASRGASASAASSAKGSSAGKGTLNITSTPSAMVILDGRPIGKTPRMGVKVSPGAHSIVFVSDQGRKRATTKVAAGASKTVNVRF